MSQQPKRPGTRDISELKARLGLKKAGGAAPAKSSGGVVAPPGVAVPPPPGVKPAGPTLPSAADDPFGHMNAMAQIGTMQRAPEIVIVNDGKPVEHVGASKRFAQIGKYVGIALVPLVLGIVIGQIAKDANIYNAGLRDAGFVLADVKAVKKGLSDVQRAMVDAKKGPVFDVTKVGVAIAAAEKIELKPELVFKAKQNTFDADLSSQVLKFYAMTTELKDLVEEHAKLGKNDELSLKAAIAASDAAKPENNDALQGTNYKSHGVLLVNPTEEESKDLRPGVYVVEIGPPVCGDGKVSSNRTCAQGGPTGFTYRLNQSSPWMKGELGSPPGGEPFPAQKLYIISPSDTMDALIKTSPNNATEELYQRRLFQVAKKLEDTIKQANLIETLLVKKTGEAPRFSFFL